MLLFPVLALGLEPTKIKLTSCGGSETWQLTAPATTKPNPPSLNMSMTSPTKVSNMYAYGASGSLGIYGHPLGVFPINASGPACGDQTFHIYDGILGQVHLSVPPCDKNGLGSGTEISAHVDVWTVLPAIPPLVSTSFEIDIKVYAPAPSPPAPHLLLCAKLELMQPPKSGADPTQDTCQTDVTPPVPYPPTDEASLMPTVTVDLDAPPATRWAHVVGPRKAGIKHLIDSFLTGQFKHMKPNSTIMKVRSAPTSVNTPPRAAAAAATKPSPARSPHRRLS
jgi:hypothetical protein